jgi:hypothetical protein
MTEIACVCCQDTYWVCEVHDDRPWDGPHGRALPGLQSIRQGSSAEAASGLRAR